jgi:hypothetical protein
MRPFKKCKPTQDDVNNYKKNIFITMNDIINYCKNISHSIQDITVFLRNYKPTHYNIITKEINQYIKFNYSDDLDYLIDIIKIFITNQEEIITKSMLVYGRTPIGFIKSYYKWTKNIQKYY